MDQRAELRTRTGKVFGSIEDDLVVFRGIPYAAPPVGPLRWRRPHRPESWLGTRPCVEFGASAPQHAGADGLSLGPGGPDPSEDCLFLNVWTPGCDDRRRPVLVFVHGGGFVSGSGSVVVYDGSELARRGAVVVTINYRLGALGFLAHPALADHLGGSGFGNWGLADQLEAFDWVRDHAAALGGDPDNLTVFGESAGAISLAALLGSPSSAGCFRRAILESGNAHTASPTSAARVAEHIASELGLSEVDRPSLERAPVEELLGAQASAASGAGVGGLAFLPVVDGGILPARPMAEIARGRSRDVDVLIGSNRDEWKFFTFLSPGFADLSEARLSELVAGHLASSTGSAVADPDEVIDTYRAVRMARGASTTPAELYAAIASDVVFRVPSMRLAERQAAAGGRVYSYLFDWESPLGDRVGACHALELPFVFGTVRHPVLARFAGEGELAVELSEQIQDAWLAFASGGDPSNPRTGPWPTYDAKQRATMVLGPATKCCAAPLDEERDVVDRVLDALDPEGVIDGAAVSAPN